MACWTLLEAFVPGSPWYAGVFVTCAIALGLTIPSAPSGAGLFEAAAIAALALFEIPVDVALAYAVLLHVLVFIISAIFGVYGLHIEGQNFSGITTPREIYWPSADDSRPTKLGRLFITFEYNRALIKDSYSLRDYEWWKSISRSLPSYYISYDSGVTVIKHHKIAVH